MRCLLMVAGSSLVVLSAASAGAGMVDPGTLLAPPEGYALVWQDEFERDGMPSEELWRYDTSRNRQGWYNDEQQYYARSRAANARVESGRLIIEARHESLEDQPPEDWGRQHFTSARLTTKGVQNWHRGFFEVRAKLPCVRGTWPAIWLLPDAHRGRWIGGEIDIVEAVGHEPGMVHHAVHTRERNFRRGNHLRSSSPLDACGGFHDYQVLWTEDEVRVGVDGETALVADAEEFDQPMSLIINVAVGGSWGGAEGIDEAAFPARMEIEHVRVYQQRGQ